MKYVVFNLCNIYPWFASDYFQLCPNRSIGSKSLIIGFNRNVIQRHFQNCSIWNIRINEFRATIFTFQRSKQHLDFSWFRPIYHCVSNASVFIFNNLEFKFLIKKLIQWILALWCVWKNSIYFYIGTWSGLLILELFLLKFTLLIFNEFYFPFYNPSSPKWSSLIKKRTP